MEAHEGEKNQRFVLLKVLTFALVLCNQFFCFLLQRLLVLVLLVPIHEQIEGLVRRLLHLHACEDVDEPSPHF